MREKQNSFLTHLTLSFFHSIPPSVPFMKLWTFIQGIWSYVPTSFFFISWRFLIKFVSGPLVSARSTIIESIIATFQYLGYDIQITVN